MPIQVTLTSDTALLALLQFTGELRYEQFYQRISR